MWSLVVLCSVIALHGVEGDERFQTSPPAESTMAYWATHSVMDCGGFLYDSNGTIKSPNYPNNYPNHADCIWYIRPGNSNVKLEILSLQLEDDVHCNYDAVYVYDGSSVWFRLLGTLCGSKNDTFYSTGPYMTVHFRSNNVITNRGFLAQYKTVTEGSCSYNCGYFVGNCSCSSGCEYRGNCCPDYEVYCSSTTVSPTTARPSCRYNCGSHMGSCSCSSSCQYNGNCCHDYYSYCYYNTQVTPTARPSCRYNCGSHMGSCSCSSSCRYNGNCCHDYYSYCYYTTEVPRTPTARPSCRYNCGSHMGSCSCSSSCRYNGNCCHDYYSYCYGWNTTPSPTEIPCGGRLFGSGSLTSPNHPSYYHDNANCVWQLRAPSEERLYLTFTYLQLESCCNCDYIAVYDGPSLSSRYLGKVCNDSLKTFHSSSNYLTVRFRTDGSVVGRGFRAEFRNSLAPHLGRVDCSSDNMNIVIQRSYLNSLGYSSYSLYLNDPYCRPQVTAYEVVFTFPINTCGTIREFDNSRILYTNALRADGSDSGEITRQSHFKLNVSCIMEQDSVSQIIYTAEHSDNSSLTGTGRFNTTMAFYTSSSFYYKVTEVPYQVKLNQDLYVQVDLRRGDSTLVLYLDTCVASPSPHDFQTRSYDLIRNGCREDNTVRTYLSGSHPYARFKFKAFKFLRATEFVYIQCKVLICPASDHNSPCRHKCNRRVARDLGSDHESQTVVLGPITLKEPEKKEGTPEKAEA